MRLTIILAWMIFVTGCSSLVPTPEAPEMTSAQAEKAWATVLKKHVDNQGRVDFRGLGASPADLKGYVRYVSRVDKASLTDPRARLAFYINAYNALSMYNVIYSEYPEDLDGFFKRFGFFYKKKFQIMKEEMSLYSFENDLIRTENDPRVHVALNCMSAGCPRLPQTPFTTAGLEKELEREAKKFYNEPRNVRTDPKEKKVYISEILDFFTEDFLKKKPTLIEYVNLYRNEKVPADYKVEFIPYDWTIYKQPEKAKSLACTAVTKQCAESDYSPKSKAGRVVSGENTSP